MSRKNEDQPGKTFRSAAMAKADGRRALAQRGGRILTAQLEPESVGHLERVRRPGETDASVIRRVLARVQGLDWGFHQP